jgi:hypothetical protein
LAVVANYELSKSLFVVLCDKQNLPIQPSQFNVVIEGNNPSQTRFVGSSTGTDIYLEPGKYSVTEEELDSTTPAICTTMGFEAGLNPSELGEDLFICTNFSVGCEGEITIGSAQTCIINNVLVQQQNPLDLAVANNVDGDVSILLGNGDGTFDTPIDFQVGNSPHGIAVGNFD